MFVDFKRRRYFSGNTMTAIASSKPSSRQATAFGAVFAKRFTNSSRCRRASTTSVEEKISFAASRESSAFATRAVAKHVAHQWTWQRCQVAGKLLVDRFDQAGVIIGYNEINAAQAAPFERCKQLVPGCRALNQLGAWFPYSDERAASGALGAAHALLQGCP